MQDGEEDGLQSADVSDEDIDYSDDGVRHWQNFALMNASVVKCTRVTAAQCTVVKYRVVIGIRYAASVTLQVSRQDGDWYYAGAVCSLTCYLGCADDDGMLEEEAEELVARLG